MPCLFFVILCFNMFKKIINASLISFVSLLNFSNAETAYSPAVTVTGGA